MKWQLQIGLVILANRVDHSYPRLHRVMLWIFQGLKPLHDRAGESWGLKSVIRITDNKWVYENITKGKPTGFLLVASEALCYSDWLVERISYYWITYSEVNIRLSNRMIPPLDDRYALLRRNTKIWHLKSRIEAPVHGNRGLVPHILVAISQSGKRQLRIFEWIYVDCPMSTSLRNTASLVLRCTDSKNCHDIRIMLVSWRERNLGTK